MNKVIMVGVFHILFQDLSQIIEQGKRLIAVQVNSTLTLTYWQIGKK